jgi:Uma2 family endonuclease
MATISIPPPPCTSLPDHTQLPDKDGSIVINFQEAPQSTALTDSLLPYLTRVYPDGQYLIGMDCGIYWRVTDPPLDGCKAPDWFLVPDVPPMLAGRIRRSYVLWQEIIPPLIVIEYVSGDGSEERDRTPHQGKFWVYERGIRAWYYAIFEAEKDQVEVYELHRGRYQRLCPNERGRYTIVPLDVELGIWHGRFHNMEASWLRWWDRDGNLLLTGGERADRLAERLRSLGIDPDTV